MKYSGKYGIAEIIEKLSLEIMSLEVIVQNLYEITGHDKEYLELKEATDMASTLTQFTFDEDSRKSLRENINKGKYKGEEKKYAEYTLNLSDEAIAKFAVKELLDDIEKETEEE